MNKDNEKKNKIRTINLDSDVNNFLEIEVEKQDMNYSSMLNRVLRYTIALNPNIKHELATFAYNKYIELQKRIDDEKGVRKGELSKEQEEYRNLVEIFTSGEGSKALEVENFQNIKMKNNSYLVCPKDWIYLKDVGKESSATNAYVVEFYNSAKFELPHYVFITDKDTLDVAFQKNVLDKIADINEHYKNIRRKYPDPRLDSQSDILPHSDIIKNSPMSGFFKIPVLGSSTEYPMGAMIIEPK